MSRSVYNDNDFHGNELLNARLHNVTSLTTVTSAAKGRIEYIGKPFFVDDNGSWVGLHPDYWSLETQAITPYDAEIRETDLLTMQSSFLHNSFRNIYKTVYYDDSTPATLGSITKLGSASTVNWALQNGRRFVLTARNGSWFNILNNQPNSDNNAKPILTSTGKDIYNVTFAEFIYNANNEAWNLVSYEKLPIWHKRNSFTVNDYNSGEYDIVYSKLPAEGFYSISAFTTVAEKTLPGLQPRVNTTGEQELRIIKTAGNTFNVLIDRSPTFSIGAGGGVFVNHSLQGSAIIEVKGKQSEREITLKLVAPNGTYRDFAGYFHLQYLGYDDEGNYL